MKDIVKFDLKELEKSNTPFANYILGRSYEFRRKWCNSRL